MVGRGHDDREERLSSLRLCVVVAQRRVEQVFVRDAPDVLEAHRLRNLRAVAHLESVVREEVVHVVEVAVAAVQEARAVTLLAHHRAPGGNAFIARPTQHRHARDRRQRGRDRLESAYRTSAGRVHVLEPHALLSNAIELRRPVVLRAVELAEFGTEGFARHHDDVELAQAARIARIAAVDSTFGQSSEASQAVILHVSDEALQVLLRRSARVVRVIVDLVGTQSAEEAARAVSGDFVRNPVVGGGERVSFETDRTRRQHCSERAEHQAALLESRDQRSRR